MGQDSEIRIIRHDDLVALLDAAAERGATRALAKVGLQDKNAGRDVGELRALLAAWRTTRGVVLTTAVQMLTRAVLLLLVLGVAAKWLDLLPTKWLGK